MQEQSREALEALLRLQSAETTIRRLERRLEELPEQAALDASLELSARVQADEDRLRVDLQDTERTMRRFEGEIDLLQQRLERDRSRLYGGEISNPRELQAVRAELDSLAARISGQEDQLLDVLERREELAQAVGSLEERGRQLAAEQEELTHARDTAAKDILAELAEARVSRDAERGRLPEPLLRRFDDTRDRRGAVAVGQLEHGICTACRMELTPLERSQLLDGEPLSTCPQCQRLLVVLES